MGFWKFSTMADGRDDPGLCGRIEVHSKTMNTTPSQVATIPTFATSVSILLPPFISSVVIKPPG